MSQKETRRRKYLNEGDGSVCRECGKVFKMLGKHVSAAHGISPRDYKIKHGLPLTLGLVSEELFNRLSTIRSGHKNKDPLMMVRMLVANPPGPGHKCHRGPTEGKLSDNLKVRAYAHRARQERNATELWESRREMFTKLWMEGATIATIMSVFGVSEGTVRSRRRTYGLPARKMTFTMTSST